jgi:hypothetical protein
MRLISILALLMFSSRIALWVLLMLVLAGPLQAAETPNENTTETTTESDGSATPPAEEEKPSKFKAWMQAKKAKAEADPNRGRFLPIPIFITEPAIGDGLGLALTYFHRKKEGSQPSTMASLDSVGSVSKEQEPPPTATAAFGAYTSNETAAAGVGHMNSFKDDHIRFVGVAAYADVNSTFYILDKPLKFNLEGVFIYQETRFRIKDSRWFMGIGASYLDASTAFRAELPDETPIELFPTDLTNVGLAGKLAWDSRDNTSMPNSGQFLDFTLWRYDDAIGSDFDYWNGKIKLLSFHQLHEKWVLGLRFEYSAISGEAPFFAVPYVKLRGIPALRYQGDRVVTGEIEARYSFTPKWSMTGFTGAGKVNSDIPIIDTEQNIYSYGLGVRYKIFDAQNVWIGLDIAKGPEDVNWYIQVGQSW